MHSFVWKHAEKGPRDFCVYVPLRREKHATLLITIFSRNNAGEMLVGPAKALFMDEISTGLDSSTTYQVVNSIRQSVHILKGTILMSLLQPEPETYDLFDDIILISEGHLVYQGPRHHILEFFESMGFKCPERKGAADFLQEVCPFLHLYVTLL